MPRCVESIDREWPPEKWRWSPDLGRWSPEYGMPNQPIVFQISTASVRQEEAYDYWCHMALYNFEADRLPESQKRTFRAEATVLATSQGILSTYQSCSISGQRSVHEGVSHGCRTFTIGLVLEGRRWHRDETGNVYIATPGDLFCYDAARTSRVAWTDPRGVLLTLPRATIEAAIGSIPSATALSKALSGSNFAPFLQAHFRTVSDALKYLNLAERTATFQHSVDLVLTSLREALRTDVTSHKIDRSIHFFTAKQLILQQLSNPNLDASTIAHALRCSRATLYRAFADRGWTVAAFIREARLQAAADRLFRDPHVKIEAVARSCGFVSPSHFSRLFRSRFGVLPKEARGIPLSSRSIIHRVSG